MTEVIQETSLSKDIFSDKEIEIIKATIMPNCTDHELLMFMKICGRTKLDPFARQIYAIKNEVWNKKLQQTEAKYMFVVSIDGMRLIADRSGKYEGQTDTQWCGADGLWTDVWLKSIPPSAARVGVYKHGHRQPTFAVATWNSYAKISKDGRAIGTWAKMPDLMLAKCSEALALRKVFPHELSGVYSEDELDQAIKEVTPIQNESNVLSPPVKLKDVRSLPVEPIKPSLDSSSSHRRELNDNPTHQTIAGGDNFTSGNYVVPGGAYEGRCIKDLSPEIIQSMVSYFNEHGSVVLSKYPWFEEFLWHAELFEKDSVKA